MQRAVGSGACRQMLGATCHRTTRGAAVRHAELASTLTVHGPQALRLALEHGGGVAAQRRLHKQALAARCVVDVGGRPGAAACSVCVGVGREAARARLGVSAVRLRSQLASRLCRTGPHSPANLVPVTSPRFKFSVIQAAAGSDALRQYGARRGCGERRGTASRGSGLGLHCVHRDLGPDLAPMQAEGSSLGPAESRTGSGLGRTRRHSPSCRPQAVDSDREWPRLGLQANSATASAAFACNACCEGRPSLAARSAAALELSASTPVAQIALITDSKCFGG